jgi:hypothetical protein
MVLISFGGHRVHGVLRGLPQVRIMLIGPIDIQAVEGTDKLL